VKYESGNATPLTDYDGNIEKFEDVLDIIDSNAAATNDGFLLITSENGNSVDIYNHGFR
jgi:hypothetical protein